MIFKTNYQFKTEDYNQVASDVKAEAANLNIEYEISIRNINSKGHRIELDDFKPYGYVTTPEGKIIDINNFTIDGTDYFQDIEEELQFAVNVETKTILIL